MTLSPLAIALQGIGFGSMLTALQGFAHYSPGGQFAGGKRYPEWTLAPFLHHKPKRRPKKRRDQEILFMA